MAVRAVQSDSDVSKKNNNYLLPALIGGFSGYVLKWALPLSKFEQDEDFQKEVKKIGEKANEVRLKEIEEIRKASPKPTGIDEFLKVVNKPSIDTEKLSWGARDLLARVENRVEETRSISYDNLVVSVKRIRPAASFILLGMGVGLLFGFARAVMSGGNKKESKPD